MPGIEIDGSLGEGGGQILRTSLALSAVTGRSTTIVNIRSQRPSPGLRPQHLAAVKTIASACNAKLSGAKVGSTKLSFEPGLPEKTNLNVSIGTAGSIPLLISQVLPLSLLQEMTLHVHGGTNVPFSPPAEFLKACLFPVLRRAGAKLELNISRRGYYPKGQGLVSFSSRPACLPLKPISLKKQGALQLVKIFSHCSSLPRKVALNQAAAARHELKGLGVEFEEAVECREKSEAIGSGITLFACFSSGAVLSGSALGEKGKPAEMVGREAAQALAKEVASKKACDSHLADQLIPFMALAKGESVIEATRLSSHCQTNIGITERFLPARFKVDGEIGKPAKISVSGTGFSGKEK
jgi:RNA 3'-phosphate cyclase